MLHLITNGSPPPSPLAVDTKTRSKNQNCRCKNCMFNLVIKIYVLCIIVSENLYNNIKGKKVSKKTKEGTGYIINFHKMN